MVGPRPVNLKMVPRARGPILLLAAGLSLPSPATATPSGSLSVEVGGGHDDNMFLATAPVAADPLLRLGGWFAGVSPAVEGAITFGGARLAATYLGDLRQAETVGRLGYHEGELMFIAPALGPLRLHLAGTAGRFDASQFPDDRFSFAGGEAGLRLAMGEAWQARLRYRAERRWLGATGASTDLLHAVEARAPWQASPWFEIGPRGSLVLVQPSSSPGSTTFRRLRGGLEAALLAGPLLATASAWAGTLELGTARETHAGGRVEARVTFGRHLQLFASVDLSTPVSADASRDYARRVLTVGTAVIAAGAMAPSRRPAEPEQRPLVEAGRVRFRLRAASAASVAVVGSWDDWQTPGQVLPATREPGLREVWVDLPEGSYRYHFVVDGQAQRPPEAPRYAPDGFGGEDGVVDVPPQGATTSGRSP
jgi:hypothetical protein